MNAAIRWTVVSLVLFVLAEAAIFRSGWYNKYLEPNSSAGEIESYLYWLSKPDPVRVPEILMVGDSRIAEGFSAPLADKLTANRVHFWNFGLGGTTPRVWYYLLRDADPTRRRFGAIVLALDGYADDDRWDSLPDRAIDLNFIIGRLRLSDCWGFANSMVSFKYKLQSLEGCLFKGVALRSDVQALLQNRLARMKSSQLWRESGVVFLDDYPGMPGSLEGLSADYQQGTIHFPPGFNEAAKGALHDWLMPPPLAYTGATTRYRQLWLNRILDLYKDSPTKLIFLELARAPVPKPEHKEPAVWLNEALKRPRVYALPQQMFRDLERPELFFDMLHFNKVGRGLFTEKIAQQVPSLIGVK